MDQIRNRPGMAGRPCTIDGIKCATLREGVQVLQQLTDSKGSEQGLRYACERGRGIYLGIPVSMDYSEEEGGEIIEVAPRESHLPRRYSVTGRLLLIDAPGLEQGIPGVWR